MGLCLHCALHSSKHKRRGLTVLAVQLLSQTYRYRNHLLRHRILCWGNDPATEGLYGSVSRSGLGSGLGEKVSDTVPFQLTSRKDVIVAFDTARGNQAFNRTEKELGVQGYSKPESQSAGLDAPSGFSPFPAGTLLSLGRIYVLPAFDSYALETRSDPDDPIAVDRRQRASSDFSEVIRLDPERTGAYIGRGVFQYSLEDYLEAISD